MLIKKKCKNVAGQIKIIILRVAAQLFASKTNCECL